MIGQSIKKARKAAGLTQEDLANAIGVKRAVISKYENGQIEPRYQTVERIAEALHCNISDLVNSKDHAHMIIDDALEGGDLDNDDILDAFDELNHPGSIALRYTRFIAEYPQIIQTLKEIGIELKIIDWHRIRIKYDYQEGEERISEVLSDLESLYKSYTDSIKHLFKNNYGFTEIEED